MGKGVGQIRGKGEMEGGVTEMAEGQGREMG